MDPDSSFMPTGSITITTGLSGEGKSGLKFEVDGLSPIQAIGAVTTVGDLLRSREVQGWATGGRSGSGDV